MKAKLSLCLALLLLLCGCSPFGDGSYSSETPHKPQTTPSDSSQVQAADYKGVVAALEAMAESGTESGIIHIPDYNLSTIEEDMEKAINSVLLGNPIAAYAVEEIQWELGTNAGQNALAITMTYLHNRTELRKIVKVTTVEEAMEKISSTLYDCSPTLVLYIEDYHKTDFIQTVADYAMANPQFVMEAPQVTANIYPQWGASRVVELKFLYQTPRESLKMMQNQVSPIFSAAKLYVSGDAAPWQKFSQLYSLLMERYDYTIETSITPTYSLLCHGVGDSKAFSSVYAAMCRDAELQCRIISGTRHGEGWYWVMIQMGEEYYHVDLLRSNAIGAFQMLTDEQMQGYVWDFSDVPTTP